VNAARWRPHRPPDLVRITRPDPTSPPPRKEPGRTASPSRGAGPTHRDVRPACRSRARTGDAAVLRARVPDDARGRFCGRKRPGVHQWATPDVNNGSIPVRPFLLFARGGAGRPRFPRSRWPGGANAPGGNPSPGASSPPLERPGQQVVVKPRWRCGGRQRARRAPAPDGYTPPGDNGTHGTPSTLYAKLPAGLRCRSDSR
jgi:hypothetical protein